VLFFVQAEDGIRDFHVTGVQTCALPIFPVKRSSQACPAVIRDDCKLLFTGTQNRIPTIVTSAGGATSVTISIDGAAAAALTPTPLELDPGSHSLRFTAGDGRTVDRTVVLEPGMENNEVKAV